MAAYAIAHLHNPTLGPDVFEYLERIDSTLEPYSGRFLIHGGAMEVSEGAWPGAVVIIEFPGMANAKSWYRSPAYQKILPLRTGHITSDVIIAEGVESGHNSAAMAAELRQTTGDVLSKSTFSLTNDGQASHPRNAILPDTPCFPAVRRNHGP